MFMLTSPPPPPRSYAFPLRSCGPRRLVHRWYGGSGLTPYAEALAAYLDEVQRRAARDGKAFNAEKAVRFFFK